MPNQLPDEKNSETFESVGIWGECGEFGVPGSLWLTLIDMAQRYGWNPAGTSHPDPEYVEFDDHRWRTVLAVRPGITDLASLAFRNEEEILGPAPDPEAYYRSVILPEKLRLNLLYQQSRTLERDLKLLWMTARYSFFPRGFDRDRIMRSLGA